MAEKNDYVSDSELNDNLHNLKKFIDSLSIDEDDIVVLQEIPHKILVDNSMSPWLWEQLEMFRKFKTTFEKSYTVFYPRFLIDSKQCTVALANINTKWNYSSRNIIQYDGVHHYGNKLIEVEKDNVILLGVHINPCDAMWNMILPSLKNTKITFIVGDFNAYEKRGKMKDKPELLRSLGYNSVVPCNKGGYRKNRIICHRPCYLYI